MGVHEGVHAAATHLLGARPRQPDFDVGRELREKLLGAGLTNLWVPKIIHRVSEIPVLGTGKLDLKRCRDLALEAAAAAGGANRETDDELVQRVRAKPLSYRRGTLAALEYGALTVAGVANAVATEDSTGLVTIYVADASGSSNGTMTTNVTTSVRLR